MRLRDLLYINHFARAKHEVVVWVVAAGFVLITSAMGVSEETISDWLVYVIAATMITLAAKYAVKWDTTHNKIQVFCQRWVVRFIVWVQLRRYAIILSTVAVMGLIAVIPFPTIEASLVDKRLQEIIERTSGVKTVREIGILAAKSQIAKLRARPATMREMASKVLIAPNTYVEWWWASVQNVASYITTLTPAPRESDLISFYGLAPPNQFVLNLTGQAKYTFSVTYDGDLVPMHEASFGIRVNESTPSSRVVQGPAHVYVRYMDSPLLLDGLNYRKVTLWDSTVTYNGGDLILNNVVFSNCVFDMPFSPAAERLIKAVIQGNPVSFVQQSNQESQK